eukprot:TRINITY_DN5802_c0_g1_i1.p1 TRINITY_DN5802_c0_g1~~TRINITY_DN5802_c0_g1_i1.p1  ORF type:complete len:322 (+),score=92.61 TRINITY_DN5802_c0_g1_i1:117-968(+)
MGQKDEDSETLSSSVPEKSCMDAAREKNLFMKVLFSSPRASLLDMRRLLMMQLFIFTFLNSCNAGYKFILGIHHNVNEKNAIIVSLCLVWSMIPPGVYALYYNNRGMLSVYIMYGMFVGCARVAYLVIAITMMAVSCQFEQVEFNGCKEASVELLCLQNSTCHRHDITAYNDLHPDHHCLAWGTDDCDTAPLTQNSLGFEWYRVSVLIVDIFTAYVPLYLAYLYLLRLEGLYASCEEIPLSSNENTPFLSSFQPRDIHDVQKALERRAQEKQVEEDTYVPAAL